MGRRYKGIRTAEGKTCAKCKRMLAFEKFSKNSNAPDGLTWYCKDCVKHGDRKRYIAINGERDRNLRQQLKNDYIEKMGGGCARCGYSEFIAALDFHHTEDKEGQISVLMGHAIPALKPEKLAALEQELAKCILLCTNCHRGLHAGMWQMSEETYIKRTRFDPEYEPRTNELDYLPLFAGLEL